VFLQVGGACYVYLYFMSIGNHVRTSVCFLSFELTAVVACTFLICNRTGPLQNGSLAGVAHLLQCNTGVPRAAP